MHHRPRQLPRLLLAASITSLGIPAHAAFLDESKASLELRNFYFNRDFRQEGAPKRRPKSGRRAFCCATNPVSPTAPSVSGSMPSACSGSSSTPAPNARAPGCSSAIEKRHGAPRTPTPTWG